MGRTPVVLRNLLIADDHPICVAALTIAAHGVDSAIMVETAETIAAVERLLRDKRFDLVLLDLRLRDSEGLGNLALALAARPRTPVVVVSSSDAAATIARARTMGARGFLSKAADLKEMRLAIAAVLDGGSWFPDIVGTAREDAASADGVAEAIDRLTPAQIRVANELVKGHSNKLIAHNLSLAEPTVKSHLGAIFRATNASNRSQAMVILRSSRPLN